MLSEALLIAVLVVALLLLVGLVFEEHKHALHSRRQRFEREVHRSFLESARQDAETQGKRELVRLIDMEAAAHRLELRRLRPGRAGDYN